MPAAATFPRTCKLLSAAKATAEALWPKWRAYPGPRECPFARPCTPDRRRWQDPSGGYLPSPTLLPLPPTTRVAAAVPRSTGKMKPPFHLSWQTNDCENCSCVIGSLPWQVRPNQSASLYFPWCIEGKVVWAWMKPELVSLVREPE